MVPFYLFIFKENVGKDKDRERNITVWFPLILPQIGPWLGTQACVLIGNRTSDPLVLRLAHNPLTYTSQGHMYMHFIHLVIHGWTLGLLQSLSCGEYATVNIMYKYILKPLLSLT